jgi:hypothetical protein
MIVFTCSFSTVQQGRHDDDHGHATPLARGTTRIANKSFKLGANRGAINSPILAFRAFLYFLTPLGSSLG